MKKSPLRATIQLSMGEYIDAFTGLVVEHYQRAVSDDGLFQELSLTEEEQARFSVEYSTVLLVLACLAFRLKPKLTTDKYRERIQERISEGTYRKILSDADDETIQGCMAFLAAKRQIFEQICKNSYSTVASNRQKDVVGFARYLAAQVSSRDEESNMKALEKLGILLSCANDSFVTLIANSVQDTVRMDGKPSFAIQK